MRSVLSICAGLLLSLAPLSAQADQAACRNLFEKAPEQVGNLRLFRRHTYQNQPHLGYSATYGTPQRKLTVYFFDMGQPTITDETLLRVFQSSANDIRTVTQRLGKKLLSLKASERRNPGTGLRYIAVGEVEGGITEFLGLMQSDNCMIKYRMTVSQVGEPALRAILDLVLLFHTEHLRIE